MAGTTSEVQHQLQPNMGSSSQVRSSSQSGQKLKCAVAARAELQRGKGQEGRRPIGMCDMPLLLPPPLLLLSMSGVINYIFCYILNYNL